MVAGVLSLPSTLLVPQHWLGIEKKKLECSIKELILNIRNQLKKGPVIKCIKAEITKKLTLGLG